MRCDPHLLEPRILKVSKAGLQQGQWGLGARRHILVQQGRRISPKPCHIRAVERNSPSRNPLSSTRDSSSSTAALDGAHTSIRGLCTPWARPASLPATPSPSSLPACHLIPSLLAPACGSGSGGQNLLLHVLQEVTDARPIPLLAPCAGPLVGGSEPCARPCSQTQQLGPSAQAPHWSPEALMLRQTTPPRPTPPPLSPFSVPASLLGPMLWAAMRF